MIFGTLSRLLNSIHKSYNTFLRVWMLYYIQAIVILGLILGIVGGIDAGNSFKQGNASGQHVFYPGSLNKAGSILLITSYVAIVITTALLSIFRSHIESGERDSSSQSSWRFHSFSCASSTPPSAHSATNPNLTFLTEILPSSSAWL